MLAIVASAWSVGSVWANINPPKKHAQPAKNDL
jgi:hypothetical protein